MTDDLKTKLEDEDLTLYDNFYKKKPIKALHTEFINEK